MNFPLFFPLKQSEDSKINYLLKDENKTTTESEANKKTDSRINPELSSAVPGTAHTL